MSSAREPEYIKLYKKLSGEIASGVFKHGDRLPSKRALSDSTGLSPVTVEHAYALLLEEGYAESRERSGYYVSYDDGQFRPPVDGADNAARTPLRRNSEAMSALDLPGPAFHFPTWAKTVRQVLSSRQENIFERSPNRGHPELRLALRDFLARSRGINCKPEQIIIGSGSDCQYERLIRLFGRDSIFGVESPSYSQIARIYRAGGARLELLKLGVNGILSDELARTSASVLHVTPYRSFPSGVTADAGKRREYLNWASAPGRYIIEDDAESEFTVMRRPASPLYALSERGNVVYMNTFSVTLSPSLRISYMVLPERMLTRYEETSGFYSCPVPTFEQLILAEFIRSGEFERYVNRVRRLKRGQQTSQSQSQS